MIDFLTSAQGQTMLVLLGILAVIAYVVITILESIFTNDFDPVCEKKCKDCICYNMCRDHGCVYDCPDYMTEEMLQKKGFIR
jgi:hypothetical protein